jgi:hypothetical protein
MRRLVNPKIAAFTVILFIACVASAQRKEYFADTEIDQIRETQELPMRVSLYFRLADFRLTALGLKEKSAKERDEERKAEEQRQKEVRNAQKAGKAGPKAPEKPDEYLADFTRSELLRGYTQALDEVMDNIDDSYSRKLDVRGPLEQLAKYAKEQLPVVKAFQPKNNAESLAKDEAVEMTQKAIDDSRAALEIVPKTEKVPEKTGKKP